MSDAKEREELNQSLGRISKRHSECDGKNYSLDTMPNRNNAEL